VQAEEQIELGRPDLAVRIDLSSAAGLRAAQEEIGSADEPGEVLATVVLRRLDLASLVRAGCAVTLGLTSESAASASAPR
jgi:hypothetical protein